MLFFFRFVYMFRVHFFFYFMEKDSIKTQSWRVLDDNDEDIYVQSVAHKIRGLLSEFVRSCASLDLQCSVSILVEISRLIVNSQDNGINLQIVDFLAFSRDFFSSGLELMRRSEMSDSFPLGLFLSLCDSFIKLDDRITVVFFHSDLFVTLYNRVNESEKYDHLVGIVRLFDTLTKKHNIDVYSYFLDRCFFSVIDNILLMRVIEPKDMFFFCSICDNFIKCNIFNFDIANILVQIFEKEVTDMVTSYLLISSLKTMAGSKFGVCYLSGRNIIGALIRRCIGYAYQTIRDIKLLEMNRNVLDLLNVLIGLTEEGDHIQVREAIIDNCNIGSILTTFPVVMGLTEKIDLIEEICSILLTILTNILSYQLFDITIFLRNDFIRLLNDVLKNRSSSLKRKASVLLINIICQSNKVMIVDIFETEDLLDSYFNAHLIFASGDKHDLTQYVKSLYCIYISFESADKLNMYKTVFHNDHFLEFLSSLEFDQEKQSMDAIVEKLSGIFK